MTESSLESKIRNVVKQKGGIALKWVSPGFTGVPDRIAIFPKGRIIFIEVKRKGGRVTQRQKRVIEILKGLGCEVWVVDDLEWLEWKLGEYGI